MSQRVRICLVDDDVFVLDATALGLRDAGFEVVTAPGAAAGLDLVEQRGADVIVTDLNMPGTNGAQLISQARAKWPDMPIVAITGSFLVDSAGARSVGADAVVAKPFRPSQLKEVIERLLAERQARRSA